ncbi:MAG: hypothetical protein AABZ31_07725, partial [Bdellovibrionota bacterium]
MASPHLSKNDIVKDYIRKVSGLYEVDYGDFKRKLGSYTNILETSLGGSHPEAKKVIEQIRQQAIFNTVGPVDNAKDLVI